MSKKSPKKKTTVSKANTKPSDELTEKQLEQVAGGLISPFVKLDGTTQGTGTPTESLSLNFSKINTTYIKQ